MSDRAYRCSVCNEPFPVISLRLDHEARHQREGE